MPSRYLYYLITSITKNKMSIKINIEMLFYLILSETIAYLLYCMTFLQPSHLPSTPELNEESHQRPASLEIRGKFQNSVKKIQMINQKFLFKISPLIKSSLVPFHQE